MTLPDLAFYNAGTEPRGALRNLVVMPRRLVRRLLRPIFQHLTQILQYLCIRLDLADQANERLQGEVQRLDAMQSALADATQSSIALGWDQAALARRIAVLEDRVEFLTRLIESELPDMERFSSENMPIEPPHMADHGPHFRVG